MLAFAVRRELLTANPAIGVKRPPGRKMERFLSDAEIGRLSVAIEEYVAMGGSIHAAAAIRLLLLTGARKSEIVELKWSSVNLSRACLFLPDSKTGRKPIYMSAPVLTILRDMPRVEGNPYVIVGQIRGDHFKSIGDVWQEVRQAAGLKEVRLHDLRHSFASVGAASSLGLPIIGTLLGHTQAATTQRYAHLSADPVRAADETIAQKIALAMSAGASNKVVPLVRKK